MCAPDGLEQFYKSPLGVAIARAAVRLTELVEECRAARRPVPSTVRRGSADLSRWAAQTLVPRGPQIVGGPQPYDVRLPGLDGL